MRAAAILVLFVGAATFNSCTANFLWGLSQQPAATTSTATASASASATAGTTTPTTTTPTLAVDPGFQIINVPQTTSLPLEVVPLASGLSLSSTTCYSKTPAAPAATCLATALDLFTGCQPFLTDLTQNGGTLSKLTILQLLETALDKTADLSCLNATLNFVNQGCICSSQVQTTLQALPTSTVPQLLKAADSLLVALFCPTGLIGSNPPPVVPLTEAPPTTASAVSTAVAGPAAG